MLPIQIACFYLQFYVQAQSTLCNQTLKSTFTLYFCINCSVHICLLSTPTTWIRGQKCKGQEAMAAAVIGSLPPHPAPTSSCQATKYKWNTFAKNKPL